MDKVMAVSALNQEIYDEVSQALKYVIQQRTWKNEDIFHALQSSRIYHQRSLAYVHENGELPCEESLVEELIGDACKTWFHANQFAVMVDEGAGWMTQYEERELAAEPAEIGVLYDKLMDIKLNLATEDGRIFCPAVFVELLESLVNSMKEKPMGFPRGVTGFIN